VELSVGDYWCVSQHPFPVRAWHSRHCFPVAAVQRTNATLAHECISSCFFFLTQGGHGWFRWFYRGLHPWHHLPTQCDVHGRRDLRTDIDGRHDWRGEWQPSPPCGALPPTRRASHAHLPARSPALDKGCSIVVVTELCLRAHAKRVMAIR